MPPKSTPHQPPIAGDAEELPSMSGNGKRPRATARRSPAQPTAITPRPPPLQTSPNGGSDPGVFAPNHTLTNPPSLSHVDPTTAQRSAHPCPVDPPTGLGNFPAPPSVGGHDPTQVPGWTQVAPWAQPTSAQSSDRPQHHFDGRTGLPTTVGASGSGRSPPSSVQSRRQKIPRQPDSNPESAEILRDLVNRAAVHLINGGQLMNKTIGLFQQQMKYPIIRTRAGTGPMYSCAFARCGYHVASEADIIEHVLTAHFVLWTDEVKLNTHLNDRDYAGGPGRSSSSSSHSTKQNKQYQRDPHLESADILRRLVETAASRLHDGAHRMNNATNLFKKRTKCPIIRTRARTEPIYGCAFGPCGYVGSKASMINHVMSAHENLWANEAALIAHLQNSRYDARFPKYHRNFEPFNPIQMTEFDDKTHTAINKSYANGDDKGDKDPTFRRWCSHHKRHTGHFPVYVHPKYKNRAEVPHGCRVCGEPRENRQDMARHLMSSHVSIEFRCEFCTWVGWQIDEWRRHMKPHLAQQNMVESNEQANSPSTSYPGPPQAPAPGIPQRAHAAPKPHRNPGGGKKSSSQIQRDQPAQADGGMTIPSTTANDNSHYTTTPPLEDSFSMNNYTQLPDAVPSPNVPPPTPQVPLQMALTPLQSSEATLDPLMVDPFPIHHEFRAMPDPVRVQLFYNDMVLLCRLYGLLDPGPWVISFMWQQP